MVDEDKFVRLVKLVMYRRLGKQLPGVCISDFTVACTDRFPALEKLKLSVGLKPPGVFFASLNVDPLDGEDISCVVNEFLPLLKERLLIQRSLRFNHAERRW